MRELRGRVDERVLRIDADLASYVHDREQQVADLLVDRARVAGLERLADLAHFFFDLVERAAPARPVKADLAAPRADLLCARERRARGDAVQRALARRLLGRLDLVPLLEDIVGGVDALGVAEHVR